MKPHFIFLCLLFLSAISCSKLDSPPIDAKVIGCGYLQQTNDSLYLQIDSTKYLATVVYTGEHKSSAITIKPIKDLPVTCFTANIFNDYQFIIGHQNSQQLEETFKENYTITIFIFVVIVVVVVLSLWDVLFERKPQKKYILD